MLEQDCNSIYEAVLAAEEYWPEVEYSLCSIFGMERELAKGKIHALRQDLDMANRENENLYAGVFNRLMQYHTDPFDVAANIVGFKPDTEPYQTGLKVYQESVSKKKPWLQTPE